MKKILFFLLTFLPWFLASILFKTDTEYYNSLNKPFFAPPPFVFAIVWSTLYLIIAISIYNTYKNNKFKDIKEYNIILAFNYVFNQLFTYFLFNLNNLFLSFVDAVIVFITSLFLYYETRELDKENSRLLIPYIIWNGFAVLLMLTVYLFNL